MFRLELDLSIYFVPPMEEVGPGIRLTRSLQLPFPPTDGLILTGNAFNPQTLSSAGFPLKQVTWDVDRELFLADKTLVSHDHPIAFIADEIRAWIDCGWRMGSLRACYEQPEYDDEPDGGDEFEAAQDDDWEEQAEHLPSTRPRLRPRDFNKLLRAVVREMAGIHNNWRVAYAIASTQVFFTDSELREVDSRSKQAYKRALDECDSMSIDEQIRWQDRVTRRYPRLDRIVSDQSD